MAEWLGNHEVHVEDARRCMPHAVNHRRSKAEVGHKVGIHDIKMKIVGAGGMGSRYTLCQVAKVRGKH